MHKLASTPITAECFEIDDYNADLDYDSTKLGDVIDKHIEFLESMRIKYLKQRMVYGKNLIDGFVSGSELEPFVYQMQY